MTPDENWTSIPPAPLASDVSTADRIFVGRPVEITDGGRVARVEVLENLKGDPLAEVSVIWAGSEELTLADLPAEGGVFLVDSADPANVTNPDGPFVSRRPIERILAGLDPLDVTPTWEQLTEQVARADAIVFADWSTAGVELAPGMPSQARLSVIEQLSGPQIVDGTIVERGPMPEQPGGPWEFSTDSSDVGTFLLQRIGDGWIVISTSPPSTIARESVRPLVGDR